MTTDNYLLSFELSKDGDVLDIHLDDKGLSELRSILDGLDKSSPSHENLMTPSWGGDELSEEAQSDSSQILNKVTIHRW